MVFNITSQVGQTTQPRILQSDRFPKMVVCRSNKFDGSKLNQIGLPETFFQTAIKNSSIQEIPDLNQTWNDVTMGIGRTLNIVNLVARNWQVGKGNQSLQFILSTRVN